MTEYLGGPESLEKLAERHARYLGYPTAFKIAVDGVPAGWVGYWESKSGDKPIYEMGWSVLPAFQGRGIATEATRIALDHARASDGPRSMHAYPIPANGPSNAICRKLGFTFLGEVEFEYPKGSFAQTNDWALDLGT